MRRSAGTKKRKKKSNLPSENFDLAYARALRLLHVRDRFEAEVRLELLKRADEATVDAVVARLTSKQVLDDARLVRAILEANVGKKAKSLDVLKEKCIARGADTESLSLFDAATDPLTEPLLKRYENTPKGRAKAARFLASRGFDEDAIESALENNFGSAEM